MINWVEKGVGLHLALADAGITINQRDRKAVLIEGDEGLAQSIIDSYDPLPLAKAEAQKRISEQIEAHIAKRKRYSDIERATFGQQLSEATAYNASKASPTPLIDKIVERSGSAKAVIATRIIEKSTEEATLAEIIIGKRKYLENMAKTATDYKVINSLEFKV